MTIKDIQTAMASEDPSTYETIKETMSFDEVLEQFRVFSNVPDEPAAPPKTADELRDEYYDEPAAPPKTADELRDEYYQNISLISGHDDIREILDHVLLSSTKYINHISGKLPTPFLSVDVETDYIGPFSEDCTLLDSMTVAAWYSLNVKGEDKTFAPMRVLRYRGYRFVQKFRDMFVGLARKDKWFGRFMRISTDALADFLKTKDELRKTDIPPIIFPDGSSPSGDHIPIGKLLEWMGSFFKPWEPGEEDIVKYEELVLKSCESMQSLMNVLVCGYCDIDEIMAFFKEHTKEELRDLLAEERRLHEESQALRSAV